MNQTIAVSPDIDSITAEIGYAIDNGVKPVNETFEAGQIIRRKTGATERRPMRIRNGRPLAGELSLDRNGFAFVDHDTAVVDFFDPAQLESVYYPEVEQLDQGHVGRRACGGLRSHSADRRSGRARGEAHSRARAVGA